MSRRALIVGASLCLGLGLIDLVHLNLRLVPAAMERDPRPRAGASPRGAGERESRLETAEEVPGRAEPGARVIEERGPVVVPFATGSADLTESARAELDRIARALKESSGAGARIAGHADERGSRRYNEALGARRARRVARYFAARGIERARLQIRSFGERRPRSPGRDPESLRANRRVEITLLRGEP